jgi:nucleoid DNA-binding protein
MANLTKRDLVVRISNETGMVQQDVLNVVQKTLDYLTESLAMGKTVELRNFGVFEIKLREARVGRNPNKPENDVPIPPRAVVKFKAGKEMKAKVAALSEKLIANANAPVANDNPPST